ncbi:MAG TPA: threonylcarbamoyl-AMP synthase [Deltaproteobacteria bacterium]|nr:threonylcarbamoyl-AMP synthase [Deltaproteobacteria bacterium]
MTARVILLDPRNPSETALSEAAGLLRDGGIIAYPTETLYGLGVDGTNEAAVEKIFTVKGRSHSIPVSLIIASWSDLEQLALNIPPAGRKLAEAFWPGGLTLLFTAAPAVSKKLTAGTGKIGVRFSSDPVAALLARRLGRPITATSANRSGGAECHNSQEVIAALGDRLDAVVDGGTTPGPPGSTIVDVTVDPPLVVREGVISKSRLDAVLQGA